MKLATVFGDNMVLQQAMPVPVWGTAKPGAKINVQFAGQQAETTADSNGDWRLNLKPLTASFDPQTLNARSSDGQSVSLKNVLVGEVWVCSGQSNMEWPVSRVAHAADEMAKANHPAIRLLSVARRVSSTPERDLPGSAVWSVCSPETIPQFSAVGYFFGRKLRESLNAPVGLINSSWGGTVAEAWTSREGLTNEPSLRDIVEKYEKELPVLKERHAEWKAFVDAHEEKTKDTQNIGYGKGWEGEKEPAGDWKDIAVPGYWQTSGYDISGIFWYRKTVEIPAKWAGKELSLAIGATDKSDVTYFNNEKVGGLTMQETPDAWCILRTYKVPGRLVKAGKNVIAVRVHSNKFAGGMTGPADAMKLSCPSVPGDAPLKLDGQWRVAIETTYGKVEFPKEPIGPGNQNSPSGLYNGMLAPLIPLAARGAIWYQGESNADRAVQYRTLFPVLIRDWRRIWGQKQFGFYFVQLANYMARAAEPCDSQWAELREAQTMTLALPETGMAVAIDIGDGGDIHPANKQDVGLRLALAALHTTYGKKDVVPSGPLYKNAVRDGKTMRISFDYADGLQKRGDRLTGFSIAGPDKKFVWADARIDGKTVVVSSPSVSDPAAVRYAWANNPDCNLYNAAGLPASPFRTDKG